jgi:hypothetical protein
VEAGETGLEAWVKAAAEAPADVATEAGVKTADESSERREST